ncbi:TonB-dependent hemoglobin/transferrin/lactoferrin family receptor [Thermaurantiacus sp.]
MPSPARLPALLLALAAPEAARSAANLAAAADPPATTITVTATRAPLSLLESPVTVTVFDLEEMRDLLVEDIRDLVRFEPGISVRRAPARFTAALASTGRDGNAGFNIRGLEGNRVLIQVDGIRVPDAFTFGAQATSRDAVDLGLVKSVEIVRGAASALYGSDGLAGAVSFQTADPADILGAGDRLAAVARSAYDSSDRQVTASGALAARSGRLSLLAGHTWRSGQELRNQGRNEAPNATRTAPNPQDRRADAFLGKLVFEPAPGHRLRLTGEHVILTTETDVLSGRTPNPTAPTSVIGLRADDRTARHRASLDWTLTGRGAIEELFVAGFWQAGRDRQFTFEDRFTAPDRTRLNTFDNEVWGLAATGRFRFSAGGIDNRLTAGSDWFRTFQEGVRDGTVPTPPDVFPTRAFPPTRFDLLGLFAADELRLAGGRLILFPGLRFDHYRLVARPDALTPNVATADTSGSRVSPKFGVTWRAADGASLVFNYAEGFRAPSPSQVNQFFDNPTSPFFAYRSIPNPDLGPERSRTFEGGLRFDQGPGSGQVTAFLGRYRDFISQEIVGGAGTIASPVIFQFRNLARVRIHGLEARGRLALGAGFTANVALAWAKGRVENPDGRTLPLLTINPLELVAGLDWRSSDSRLGASLIGTVVGAKEADETTGLCTPSCLLSDGFAILDATAFVRITDRLVLRAGIFNLLDATYVEWSSVRGLADTSGNRAVRDAFTSPGRNAGVSLTASF